MSNCKPSNCGIFGRSPALRRYGPLQKFHWVLGACSRQWEGKALRHYLNSCRRRRPNKILHPVRPVTPFTPPSEGSCISVFGAGIVLLLGGKGRRNVTRAGSSYFRCVMDVNIPPLLQFSCHFRRNSLLLLVFRAAPPLSMERARARFTCSVHP